MAVEEEIQSIFWDDSYFGLVFTDRAGGGDRTVRIYDLRCSEQTVIQTSFAYDHIGFLDNHEICMDTANQCRFILWAASKNLLMNLRMIRSAYFS